jgi:SAM-dependent methyltransferase
VALDFDRAYALPFTPWGDIRVPAELEELVQRESPRISLELGCGIGRFSRRLSRRGIRATAVDFSAKAIEKARRRAAKDPNPPDYRVGDVTRLDFLQGPFDLAFDIGCFHCLPAQGRLDYAAELHRLLPPGAMLLVWTMDRAPSGLSTDPESVQEVFARRFMLQESKSVRRRLAASRWHYLCRKPD